MSERPRTSHIPPNCQIWDTFALETGSRTLWQALASRELRKRGAELVTATDKDQTSERIDVRVQPLGPNFFQTPTVFFDGDVENHSVDGETTWPCNQSAVHVVWAPGLSSQETALLLECNIFFVARSIREAQSVCVALASRIPFQMIERNPYILSVRGLLAEFE